MNAEEREHFHPEVPRGIHPESPEDRESPRFSAWWVGGWISPILVVAFTILWTLLIYALIGDRPRDWQFGVTPYVPAESIFSIEQPPPAAPPNQVELVE
ncbi:MAG: hypothetical protein HYX78_02870 [Armatimonadetes bacterium]|nr:hypothetical protein [Armatimonadota bacterium]